MISSSKALWHNGLHDASSNGFKFKLDLGHGDSLKVHVCQWVETAVHAHAKSSSHCAR